MPGGELSAMSYLKDGQWRDKFGELIRAPSEKNPIIEQRQGISTAAKEHGANEAIDYITKKIESGNEVDRGMIEHYVYNYMTHRRSPEEVKNIMAKFSNNNFADYEAALDKIAKNEKNAGHGANPSSSWFALEDINKYAIQPKTFKINDAENVSVNFKEYFSIIPRASDQGGVVKEIQEFLNSLPAVAEELRNISHDKNDQIALKVPASLTTLIYHPDSMVVHYRNKNIGPEIREKVVKILEEKGIAVTRKDRVESGFDFKSSKGEGAVLNGSHSELISRVISQEMASSIKKNKKLNIKSPAEFIQKLDGEIDAKGKLTPEEMIKRLQAVK